MILSWFANIRVVTEDDIADFRVMLMDHHNTDDAMHAISGIFANLFEHGLNLGLLDLLLMAAQHENEASIRNLAIGELIGAMTLFDDAIRKQDDFIEQFLEILSYDYEMAYDALLRLNFIRSHMIVIGMTLKPVKKTLAYELIIVGEEASQAFDRSCC